MAGFWAAAAASASTASPGDCRSRHVPIARSAKTNASTWTLSLHQTTGPANNATAHNQPMRRETTAAPSNRSHALVIVKAQVGRTAASRVSQIAGTTMRG